MNDKGGISINISGGNASFGNISQGDQNTIVTGSVSVEAQVAPLFEETIQSLEQERLTFTDGPPETASEKHSEINAQEVIQLREELRVLKSMVCSEDKEEKAKASGFLASLQKQYSWAASALSSLANGLTVMSLL